MDLTIFDSLLEYLKKSEDKTIILHYSELIDLFGKEKINEINNASNLNDYIQAFARLLIENGYHWINDFNNKLVIFKKL